MEFKKGDIIKLPEKREVLFEKYSKQIEMKNFFYEKLNGCEIRFLKEYPSYIFFIKNNEILFEIYEFDKTKKQESTKNQESKKGNFNVRYDEIWSVFENRFALGYEQIQAFITSQVEKLLKLNRFTPDSLYGMTYDGVEKLLKLNRFTPVMATVKRF